MHAYRSHTCAELTLANVGETVRLVGLGAPECATTAGCCSSTCATTTASPRCWPTARARRSRRWRRCGRNG